MPLKLIPPHEGKSPYWSVRGTYLRTYVDRSTKAADRATAAKLLKLWKEEIERGTFARPEEPNFLDAAVNYMAETGNQLFVQPVVDHFGQNVLSEITQQAIDQASVKLYPEGSAQTHNRQVHTVVSEILKHAGIESKLKRPKGWRDNKRTDWLKPDQAFRVFKAARKIDPEFEIFLTTLCYTGMRLTEARTMMVDQMELKESFGYVRESKNDDPRGVYLPPVVVAALKRHPRPGPSRRTGFSLHEVWVPLQPYGQGQSSDRARRGIPYVPHLLPHLRDLDAPLRRPRQDWTNRNRSLARRSVGSALYARCRERGTPADRSVACRRHTDKEAQSQRLTAP